MALAAWRRAARRLRREIRTLRLACRDPRTPWYARVVAVCVVAYALSPLDLIPDPIPILGYLDDLVVVPLGLVLALRLVPPGVLADARVRAEALDDGDGGLRRMGAAIVVALWVLVAAAGAWLFVWWRRR